MTAILVDTTLTTIDCGECGGTYAIQERYRAQKQQAGGTWNCPYCKTSWGFVLSENEKLKKRLAAAQAAHDQTKAALDDTKRSLTAQKAATTRFKNRVQKGTCPCCDTNFEDLASHMASEHPEYATAE